VTDRLVRPIRAWAEYEQCRWYIFWDVMFQQWDVWNMPLTGNGGPYEQPGYSSIASAISDTDERHGPLRSLRVLYENGYELELDADDGPFPGEWEWLVLGPGQTYQASGSFKEDKDTEATGRAMIAASDYFTQVDSATLGIDSPLPEPVS
jgi:hypothetical protein